MIVDKDLFGISISYSGILRIKQIFKNAARNYF